MQWAIDVTHTAHTRAQTGIQQVCRDLVTEFSANNRGFPVVHDRYAGCWRRPDQRECTLLQPDMDATPGKRRGAAWSITQILRGRLMRLSGKSATPAWGSAGLLIPEIFDPSREERIATWPGPKVAIFHDAAPLLFPQWTPTATVQRFPAYLASIAKCDLVLCPSQQSHDDLQKCLQQLQLSCPPIRILQLGMPLSIQDAARSPISAKAHHLQPPLRPAPVVLMVGSIEARKNHLAVLKACESLWKEGCDFHLHLVGMLNRQTGLPVGRLIESLIATGYPLTWNGAASQREIVQAYREADLFLYPSLYEGFGIPVLEARCMGLPVITTSAGALRERLQEGGCVETDPDEAAIAETLKGLILDPEARRQLSSGNIRAAQRSMREVAEDLHRLLGDHWPS